MKVTISLFVLFIAAKQITSENEGKATVSNETIASNNETAPNSIFKNIADVFKKIAPIRTKNDSTVEENSTAISSIDLSIHNTTQNHFANSSTGVNSTTGIVKLEEIGFNTTSGNVSTTNITEHESKKIIKENSTVDDSSVNNATQEYLTNISTIEEILSNKTSTSEESNLYTTREALNSTTVDKITNFSLADDDSISSDENVTITPEVLAYDRTEISSEIPKLDPLQHQNYCSSYIDKLLTAAFAEHSDQLDPLILEDRKITIENTFFLSSVRGEVGLYDGKVTGMSKAISLDECNVQIRDDQVRLKSTISFDEAEISYKGRATFMEFGPKITVNGKLSGSLVEIQVSVPKDGEIGEIRSVRVRNIGRMEVDVKGLGPLNWTLELISEEIVNAFRLNFRRSLERELRNALKEEIIKISYP